MTHDGSDSYYQMLLVNYYICIYCWYKVLDGVRIDDIQMIVFYKNKVVKRRDLV